MKHVDSRLGKPLPEKDYGSNCRLYDPEKPEDPYHNFWVGVQFLMHCHSQSGFQKFALSSGSCPLVLVELYWHGKTIRRGAGGIGIFQCHQFRVSCVMQRFSTCGPQTTSGPSNWWSASKD